MYRNPEPTTTSARGLGGGSGETGRRGTNQLENILGKHELLGDDHLDTGPEARMNQTPAVQPSESLSVGLRVGASRSSRREALHRVPFIEPTMNAVYPPKTERHLDRVIVDDALFSG